MMRIDSRESLERAARRYGVLPFFGNKIAGFSVEEMTLPGLLFGGAEGYDGCWEWKGPVIGEQTTAYGKFFRRKAGFVSLELLPHFLNYRRKTYPIVTGATEEALYDLIRSREGATSPEMRNIIFSELPKGERPKRHALEPALQRLQMGGWILIADFEYKYTQRGERYGWGIALYSTPEIWLGMSDKGIEATPEESLEWLVEEVGRRLPDADPKLLRELLK